MALLRERLLNGLCDARKDKLVPCAIFEEDHRNFCQDERGSLP